MLDLKIKKIIRNIQIKANVPYLATHKLWRDCSNRTLFCIYLPKYKLKWIKIQKDLKLILFMYVMTSCYLI